MKTLLSFVLLSCVLFGQGEAPRIEFFTFDHPGYLNIGEATTISLEETSVPDDGLGDLIYTGWVEIEEIYFDWIVGAPIYSVFRDFEAEQLEEFPNITTGFFPTPYDEQYYAIFGWHTIVVRASYRYSNDPPTQPDRIITATMPVNYPQ